MIDNNEHLFQGSIIFLIKKTSGLTVKDEIISNKWLAEELHKQIYKKFEIAKVRSPFTDNIWDADVEDGQRMLFP